MKKTILLILLPGILSGCATVPKSSSGLVESSTTTETFCYDIESTQIEDRIYKYMSSCYAPVEVIIPIGGVPVSMSTAFQVVLEQLPNGKRYSVRNYIGYGFSVDVIPHAGNCKTRLTMYGVTGFWRKHFLPLDSEARGNQGICPT